jgi:dihydrofolate synthase/folylpolyglutamate synthase
VPVQDLGLKDISQRARIGSTEMKIGLLGSHQTRNAACAAVGMRAIGVNDEAIARGLESTLWPGRFEIVFEQPLIVLDGAHNAAGMRMLVQTWRAFLAARFGWSTKEMSGRARLVFAAAADKDVTEMAELLRPLTRDVLLVRLANERGADPLRLSPAFGDLPCSIHNSAAAAWAEVAGGPHAEVVLVTGSLFLVGEMLARRESSSEEYRLNERLEILPAAR